jgi:hypothetical protein
MRTLPREPWRGGQICGHQTEYGTGREVYCGNFKKTGSPVCDIHDEELREENGGALPRFAPGNALGLRLERTRWGWSVYDGDGNLCSSADDRSDLEEYYDFTLSWEPMDGDTPIPATEDEIKTWEESES